MSDDVNVDDFEDFEDKKNQEEYLKLRDSVISRCKEANIATEDREDPYGETRTLIGIQNGRDKRWFSIATIDSMNSLLSFEFEKYVYLGDFLAIANYSENLIEALIRPLSNFLPHFIFYRRIFGEASEDEEVEPIILEDTNIGRSARIELGKASNAMRILARAPYARKGGLSIKITGIDITHHNQCLEILRKLSDSIFFQLDLQYGIALSLVRDRKLSRRQRFREKRIDNDGRAEIQFPKIELDEGPSSLYWYGRSALDMPLLQFLAFYQVIEYYYPTYSQEEAKRRIRSILKDPTFRSDKDGDIGKLLTAVSGHGRGFGDERSQLRATINACLDAKDLRGFLVEDEKRAEFFSSKQKGLTDHKLPLNNSETDLRAPVADLIYDIRCKIVHTKGESSEGEVELLLPFSKEAELLYFDIELMQFIARKVLIAAGAPLSF